MVAPLTPDQPRTIGPYALLGQLGHDGLGPVFLGRSPGGDTVAVRLIRAELAADPVFRTRFLAEVTAAGQVRGPFVTPVADADLDADVPWLAMAQADSPSLAEAVRERGPLPAHSQLRLAAELAEGLDAIHAAGVVHDNLNPSNVLLAEDGARVTDFGIWKAAAESALLGTDFGSPGFLSPEQALGYDTEPPSDIFSLGAVLTFAGTGQGPFGSGTSAALMYRLVNSPADLGDLPGDLRRLVAGCLAKQPGDRPTAGRLLEEVRAIRGPEAALSALPAPPALPALPALPAPTVSGVGVSDPGATSAVAPAPAGEPSPGSGRGLSRHRRFRSSAPAWITGALLAASGAVIVFLTGVVPSSPAGQAQPQTGAAAGPASTSQAPLIASSSASVPSGSSPTAGSAGSPAGTSDPVTPAAVQGSSSSAYLSPGASSAGQSNGSASTSPAPSRSASASASPSKSASSSPSPSKSASSSPSPSKSASPSPSPSSSPSSSASPSQSAAAPSPASSPSPSPSLTSSPSSSSASSPSSSPSQATSPSSSPSVSPSASTSSG